MQIKDYIKISFSTPNEENEWIPRLHYTFMQQFEFSLFLINNLISIIHL